MTSVETMAEEKIKSKKNIVKKCKWLVKGKFEPCGKICYKNDMCGRHQFWSDKRITTPNPCKICGKAILVDYQLCLGCGGSKINYKLKCIKEKTIQNHKLLMRELKTVYKLSQKQFFI